MKSKDLRTLAVDHDGPMHEMEMTHVRAGTLYAAADTIDALLAAVRRAVYHLEGQEYLDALHILRTAMKES